MSSVLNRINLVGVAALAILCVFQWRTNRTLNLDVNVLQKSSQEQALKISEQEKNIQGLAADLDSFRNKLTRAHAELRDTIAKLQTSEREASQLAMERDQLKENIVSWTAAVKARDERITEANERIMEIGERLKDGAFKFNALATRYNDTVKQLEELIVKYNTVVTQLNEARGGEKPAAKSS